MSRFRVLPGGVSKAMAVVNSQGVQLLSGGLASVYALVTPTSAGIGEGHEPMLFVTQGGGVFTGVGVSKSFRVVNGNCTLKNVVENLVFCLYNQAEVYKTGRVWFYDTQYITAATTRPLAVYECSWSPTSRVTVTSANR